MTRFLDTPRKEITSDFKLLGMDLGEPSWDRSSFCLVLTFRGWEAGCTPFLSLRSSVHLSSLLPPFTAVGGFPPNSNPLCSRVSTCQPAALLVSLDLASRFRCRPKDTFAAANALFHLPSTPLPCPCWHGRGGAQCSVALAASWRNVRYVEVFFMRRRGIGRRLGC